MEFLVEQQANQEIELRALKKKNEDMEKALAHARIQAKRFVRPPPGFSCAGESDEAEYEFFRTLIREEFQALRAEEEKTASNDNLSQFGVDELDERNRETNFDQQIDKVLQRLMNKNPNVMRSEPNVAREIIRSEIGSGSSLIEKDTTKLDYFLTNKKNFRMWMSMFEMEISLKRLTDIIDENVPPPRPFTSKETVERKKIVKGIILGHLDETYQEHVIEISEPREILAKLQKMKRNEINDTTVSIKDQIRNLKFSLGSETAHAFNLRFDDLIRRYNLISKTEMSDQDKRDAYYHVVAKVVPQIKEAT